MQQQLQGSPVGFPESVRFHQAPRCSRQTESPNSIAGDSDLKNIENPIRVCPV